MKIINFLMQLIHLDYNTLNSKLFWSLFIHQECL